MENLIKVAQLLDDACQQQSYNDLERAGLVKFFRLAFELTWKTLKDLVEYEGYEAASPRSVIRTALQANHITPDQCETLLEALDKRNLLSHTYDEENALEAQRLIIQDFNPVINAIVNRLNLKLNNDE